MGATMSQFVKRLTSKEAMRVTMLGLDGSGKTSILFKLKLGDIVRSVPTVGFNVEMIRYKCMSFTMWDVGGQVKIRSLWRHYLNDIHALIFVVDSNDRVRMPEARSELHRVMEESMLKNVALLVFANKQDLPGAMEVSEVSRRLGLHLFTRHLWHIQSTSAATGQGLYEGLDWLAKNISKQA
uniref:ADP-ribosylation factor n=1 Tax=Kalanchoe fedtschenkoi TaxID=63787 RepID=A0A7N0ZW00_KALFE